MPQEKPERAPEATKVRWDGDNVLVQEKEDKGGYKTVYTGPLTEEVTALLTGMGIEIPRKVVIVNHLDKSLSIRISGPEVDAGSLRWYDTLHAELKAELKLARQRLKEKYPDLEIEIN